MLQFFYKIKVSYKHAIPNEHTSRSSKASIQDSLRAGPLLNPALSPAIAPNTSATHAKDRAATPGELVLEATRNLEKMKQTTRIKVYIIIIIIITVDQTK